MADIRSPGYSAAIRRLMRPGTQASAAGPAMATAITAAGVKDMVVTATTVPVHTEAVKNIVLAGAAEDMPVEVEAVMAIKCPPRNKRMVRPGPKGGLALQVLCVSLALGLSSVQAAVAQTPGQRTFNSVAEATDAFATAVGNHDEASMLAILGPSGKALISSGDSVADKNKQDTFASNYRVSHQYAVASDGRTFLYIGPNNWPTPIPLRKDGTQWYFDTNYGKQEILYRRIGSDELNVIKVCAAIVDAQEDYYAALHDGASEHQYAQRFRSSPGTQDGLYWEVKAGSQPPESPLGPLVAEAAGEGYQHHADIQPHPFHGYVYRLLTSQGANGPGGAKNYIVDGKMTGGFALIAYPVNYRDTGVMTFIVNQNGQVYQKDLGPDTEQIASEMTAYDPDSTWQPTNKATVTAQTR
jgi:Protein of unknown function (DUF2950)